MSATKQQTQVLTPQVARARAEFIRALEASLDSCGLDREEATGRLSQILSDVWTYLEGRAWQNLPAADHRAGAAQGWRDFGIAKPTGRRRDRASEPVTHVLKHRKT
jgi:hypothetical protein